MLPFISFMFMLACVGEHVYMREPEVDGTHFPQLLFYLSHLSCP